VRTVMGEMGMAVIGSGRASGPNRAREATEEAMRNPLLDDINLQGAKGILVNITSAPGLGMGEYFEVGQLLENFASEEATVKIGTAVDPDMEDELMVTVIVTGLGTRMEKPVKVVDNTVINVPLKRAVGSDFQSEHDSGMSAPKGRAGSSSGVDADDLIDIPAFI